VDTGFRYRSAGGVSGTQFEHRGAVVCGCGMCSHFGAESARTGAARFTYCGIFTAPEKAGIRVAWYSLIPPERQAGGCGLRSPEMVL